MKKSKFTEEQILRILQEAGTGEKTQAQLCRDHGISVNTFYVWKRKYGGMETRDVRLLRELEAENAQLKRIVTIRTARFTKFLGEFTNARWVSDTGFGHAILLGQLNSGWGDAGTEPLGTRVLDGDVSLLEGEDLHQAPPAFCSRNLAKCSARRAFLVAREAFRHPPQ